MIALRVKVGDLFDWDLVIENFIGFVAIELSRCEGALSGNSSLVCDEGIESADYVVG